MDKICLVITRYLDNKYNAVMTHNQRKGGKLRGLDSVDRT